MLTEDDGTLSSIARRCRASELVNTNSSAQQRSSRRESDVVRGVEAAEVLRRPFRLSLKEELKGMVGSQIVLASIES